MAAAMRQQRRASAARRAAAIAGRGLPDAGMRAAKAGPELRGRATALRQGGADWPHCGAVTRTTPSIRRTLRQTYKHGSSGCIY